MPTGARWNIAGFGSRRRPLLNDAATTYQPGTVSRRAGGNAWGVDRAAAGSEGGRDWCVANSAKEPGRTLARLVAVCLHGHGCVAGGAGMDREQAASPGGGAIRASAV